MGTEEISGIVRQLYALVSRLEELFPGRNFTLDGHLVGSIGEVVAKYLYNLELAPQGQEGIDAFTLDEPRKSVQIKLTGGRSVSFAEVDRPAEILIVLQIHPESGFSVIYNGPYPTALLQERPLSKRKVKNLPLSILRTQQQSVDTSLDDGGRLLALNQGFGGRSL